MDAGGVAEAIDVTRRHVRRLVIKRGIPLLRVGQFVRFDPAELNVWFDQPRVEPVRSRARDDAGRTTQKAPGERLELST
jgi:excisionase family DNA binding protein